MTRILETLSSFGLGGSTVYHYDLWELSRPSLSDHHLTPVFTNNNLLHLSFIGKSFKNGDFFIDFFIDPLIDLSFEVLRLLDQRSDYKRLFIVCALF